MENIKKPVVVVIQYDILQSKSKASEILAAASITVDRGSTRSFM